MSDSDLVNRGIIVTGPPHTTASGARTFIVTGLHRSGTSLMAAILHHAGVFMGQQINDAVFEDEEVLRVLGSADLGALRELIAERNDNYGTWGCKLPLIHSHLRPEQLALFNNAHLIVPFRDVASISVRKSLSEYKDPIAVLCEAADQQAAMIAFLANARTPSLLVSYEKALIFPEDFVDALMRFCGLPDNAALRARLISQIEPNRRRYIDTARQTYRGVCERIVDACLCGWSQLIGASDPVRLDVQLDGRKVTSVVADLFRPDLADAGIGEGRHGFRVDIGRFLPRRDAVLRVIVADRDIELENSGHPLSHYHGQPIA